MTNQAWYDDPKRLAFTLARYKFVAKMLAGRNNVLEIGCADAFGTRIVQQAVGKVTAIDGEREDDFLGNVVKSLCPTGVAIFGMPSLESQAYASPQSKAGHVNCKSGDALKRTLERHFHSVFVFSMNDEVVHTGFYPMANYLLGVACHSKAAA